MKSLHIILTVALVSILGACSAKSGQSAETDGVFKGIWFNSQEPENEDQYPYFMSINIDLYAKTLSRGIDLDEEKSHGGFYINNGAFEQEGNITAARTEGNNAYIEYVDPMGLIYSATLTYNPKNQQLKFEGGELINKGSKEEEEALADDTYEQYHKIVPSELLLDALVPHPHSARKGLGIYGNASKVTKENGDFIEFDRMGDILSRVSNNGEETEYYDFVVSYKQYQIKDRGPYKIIYSDHKRTDLSEDKSDSDGSVEYFFDDQDRIIRRIEHTSMYYPTSTYTYTGENKLPDSQKITTPNEYGHICTIDAYEYLEVDELGNWLKRKVSRTIESYENNDDKEVKEIHTDPPFIETQTIEYF